MKRQTSAVTMRDIAEACGVARPTVSMVLGGRPGTIALATRERILATAQVMGYRPNAGAMAVKSGRFGAIGLVLDEGCYLPTALLDGLSRACGARGLHLVVSHASAAALAGTDGHKLLDQILVDGLILNRSAAPDAILLQRLRSLPVAVRWLNQGPGGGGICPDDRGGIATLTAELIRRKHRRIAFSGLLGGDSDHISWLERWQGYRDAIAIGGQQPVELITPDRSTGAGRLQAAITHLRHEQRPDAVVCYSDRAISTYLMAASILGLSVPADLSLAAPLESLNDDLGVVPGGIPVPWAAVAEAAIASLANSTIPPDCAIPYPAVVVGGTIGRR